MPYSSDDLNKYEQLYEQEKNRLDAQKKAEQAQKIKESYAEKIEAAEDEIEIEELKNEEILKLQKVYNSSYLASLKELAKQEKEILNALKEEIKEIYSNLSDIAEDSIESVLKSQEKLLNKLSSYKNHGYSHFNVYGGGQNGGLLSYDMLNDYSTANRELMDYYNSITAVKERLKKGGFDSSLITGFLSTLSDLSIPEGSKFASVLLNSSDKDFLNAINGYNENQSLTKRISAELYSEDFTNAVDKTASYMKTELEKLGFEIPEGFTLSGTISAENFGDAFVRGLENQLEIIRNMVVNFSSSLATPSYSFDIGQGNKASASNITYNQSFTVGSSKDSTFDQITAWKNATAQARLRGQ